MGQSFPSVSAGCDARGCRPHIRPSPRPTPTTHGAVSRLADITYSYVQSAAANGTTFDTVNPATGEVLVAVASGGEKDVDRAVAAARRAFKTTWGRNVTPQERGALLNKVSSSCA